MNDPFEFSLEMDEEVEEPFSNEQETEGRVPEMCEQEEEQEPEHEPVHNQIGSENREELSDIEELEKKKKEEPEIIQFLGKHDFFAPTETNPLEVSLSGNRGIMIIPDAHFYHKNLRNRINYPDEMLCYFKEIYDFIENDETITDVIFSGDIYHRGIPSSDAEQEFFRIFLNLRDLLAERGGFIFSVAGNHEFSFVKDNPFWKYEDVILKTPDWIVVDGRYKIFLDHYHSNKSTHDFYPFIDADACVTHNDVCAPEVREEAEKKLGFKQYVDVNQMSYSRFKVRHLFVGHNHQTVGQYYLKDETTGWSMIIQHLGSLGRTNEREISNKFLERYLPVLRIENGELRDVEQKVLKLYRREQVIKEIEVLKSRETYLRSKQNQTFKNLMNEQKPLEAIVSKLGKSEETKLLLEDIMRSAQISLFYSNCDKAVQDLLVAIDEVDRVI